MSPLIKRPVAYVIASTSHGTLITNRNDFHLNNLDGYGVGWQLLEKGAYDETDVKLLLQLLNEQKQTRGNGVIALDIGSNIGVHTIEWAKYMHGWGHVYSFEAQEWVYYALAGNIAINNCYNAKAFNVAVGEKNGEINIPVPDYFRPGSFGSLELQKSNSNENIGQTIDYSKTEPVRLVSIDSLALTRIDLIKIDVEGMELDVLRGCKESIEKFRPLLFIEKIKTNEQHMRVVLDSWNYVSFEIGMNLLAIPMENDLSKKIVVQG